MNEHLFINNADNKRSLRVFEAFETDLSLPKHRDRTTGMVIAPQGTWGVITSSASNVSIANSLLWGVSSSPLRPHGFSFWRTLRDFFARKQTHAIEWYQNRTAISVTKTFEAIMGGGKKLVNLTNRLDDYSKSIEYAKSMGQTALAEQLTERLPIIQAEAVLVSAGFTQVIDEEQFIAFAAKCERGLALDWVKNFTRLIPHSAQIKKIRMDELRVFDNYLVAHFDPNCKATALTKAEIEKKKDPILFGVAKGSRRLYRVADWKDEFCDLTFDQLIEQHGKEALTLK